ncbi:MAG: hypothetical protein M0P55_14555 [Clostridiales bacterium]|jgi:hypothetical protein|nr:hypothetical protein [Clostridiales bacterium]
MTERFATAQIHAVGPSYLLTIKTGGGDYHELPALDLADANDRMLSFTQVNNLVLTSVSGFHRNGGRADSVRGSDAGRVASPVAARRLPSRRAYARG